MPNLENLRKQAKLVLRWHRDRYYPVAAQIRATLPRYRHMTDPEVLAHSFKLSDAQELVARQHGFESWEALKTGLSTMADHVQVFRRLDEDLSASADSRRLKISGLVRTRWTRP
jgi:hypothetical protein